MLIDGNEKFKTLRALNGDKIAMCEMTDYYSAKEDWQKSIGFLELLVDNEPSVCEAIFIETTGDELAYEDMLRLIANNYFHDLKDDFNACRWFNKYFDYLDYKHRNLDASEREKIKLECSQYQWMKDQYLTDRVDYRFMLKWERELFYKK